MEQAYVQIYTGEGKGKTTAALGLAIRAWGAGMKVMIIQFLKGRDSSERIALAQLEPRCSLYQAAETHKFTWQLEEDELQALQEKAVMEMHDIIEGMMLPLWDVLVLDEIFGAVEAGIVKEETLISLLNARPRTVEVILTGRKVPEAIKSRADLITEMQCQRHYFEDGVKARKGIEF